MSLKRITIVLVAASMALGAASPAFAGPNGPKDFQNKPQPKFPGPGPKDFKAPPKKVGPGPHNHHGAAIGLGIGLITAAAIAASDDDEECWQERRGPRIVTVCTED